MTDLVAEYFDLVFREPDRLPPLADDPAAAIAGARERFAAMVPDMAYVDKPDHFMASPLFFCMVQLAMYLELKEQGVDVHEFGQAMLVALAKVKPPEREESGYEFPQSDAVPAPGEFEVEVVAGGADFDWGYDIKSCAICHHFAKYDAMDLVPYMCASDDVASDLGNQGLRRTGTIALGATHCDFRYKHGGEPKRVGEDYPDRIKWIATEA